MRRKRGRKRMEERERQVVFLKCVCKYSGILFTFLFPLHFTAGFLLLNFFFFLAFFSLILCFSLSSPAFPLKKKEGEKQRRYNSSLWDREGQRWEKQSMNREKKRERKEEREKESNANSDPVKFVHSVNVFQTEIDWVYTLDTHCCQFIGIIFFFHSIPFRVYLFLFFFFLPIPKLITWMLQMKPQTFKLTAPSFSSSYIFHFFLPFFLSEVVSPSVYLSVLNSFSLFICFHNRMIMECVKYTNQIQVYQSICKRRGLKERDWKREREIGIWERSENEGESFHQRLPWSKTRRARQGSENECMSLSAIRMLQFLSFSLLFRSLLLSPSLFLGDHFWSIRALLEGWNNN